MQAIPPIAGDRAYMSAITLWLVGTGADVRPRRRVFSLNSTIASLPVFEGQTLSVLLHDGRPAMLLPEVERALGYEPWSLTGLVGKEWAGEILRDTDYTVVRGEDLAALKELLVSHPSSSLSRHTSSVTILYESGFNLVCVKTEKPVGVRLRRWLATEVLPSLRRVGSYEISEVLPTKSAPPQRAGIDVRVAELERIAAAIDRASTAEARATLVLAAELLADRPIHHLQTPAAQAESSTPSRRSKRPSTGSLRATRSPKASGPRSRLRDLRSLLSRLHDPETIPLVTAVGRLALPDRPQATTAELTEQARRWAASRQTTSTRELLAQFEAPDTKANQMAAGAILRALGFSRLTRVGSQHSRQYARPRP